MIETRKREIRIKADSFRTNCKIDRYGIIDLFKECKRAGYKLLRYPLGEGADLGFAVRRDNDIVIFTNSCNRLSREIFTLAHEIGHALLHMSEAASFVDDSVTINGRSTDEAEQEANYFAACLLMPVDEIHRFIDLEVQNFRENGLTVIDIAGIMTEFNVSFDMALNRLENLSIIDASQRVRLDNAKTEIKVGNLLRGVGGNSRLNVASEVIDIPYEYIDYVVYNYNHNAVPRETLERVLSCYGLSIDDICDKIVTPYDDGDDLDDLIGGLDI